MMTKTILFVVVLGLLFLVFGLIKYFIEGE